MPIDMAMVELPLPDPRLALELRSPSACALASGTHDDVRLLSSSPLFASRIWTSVAIGQTVERYYRQGACLLVPHEAQLEVAEPLMVEPRRQDLDYIAQTVKSARLLRFCTSDARGRGKEE